MSMSLGTGLESCLCESFDMTTSILASLMQLVASQRVGATAAALCKRNVNSLDGEMVHAVVVGKIRAALVNQREQRSLLPWSCAKNCMSSKACTTVWNTGRPFLNPPALCSSAHPRSAQCPVPNAPMLRITNSRS